MLKIKKKNKKTIMKKLNLNSMKISNPVKLSALDNFINTVNNNKNKLFVVSNKEDKTFFFSDFIINDKGYLTTTFTLPYVYSQNNKIITLNNKIDIINTYYSDMSEIENPFKK